MRSILRLLSWTIIGIFVVAFIIAASNGFSSPKKSSPTAVSGALVPPTGTMTPEQQQFVMVTVTPQLNQQAAQQNPLPTATQFQQPNAPLPAAPASVAEWVNLVAQAVEGYGVIVNGRHIQDQYGPVQVRFSVPWMLPPGWPAHTGEGKDIVGGQTVPVGVSSIYPPCEWRASLGLGLCG